MDRPGTERPYVSDSFRKNPFQCVEDACMLAGIPTLVFLTKVDNYDPELAVDIQRLNSSERIKSVMQV